MDVVIGETDYQGFAILYLERARRLSVKLYGACTREPRLSTWPVWLGLGEPTDPAFLCPLP